MQYYIMNTKMNQPNKGLVHMFNKTPLPLSADWTRLGLDLKH